jgi:hypothetical protein
MLSRCHLAQYAYPHLNIGLRFSICKRNKLPDKSLPEPLVIGLKRRSPSVIYPKVPPDRPAVRHARPSLVSTRGAD